MSFIKEISREINDFFSNIEIRTTFSELLNKSKKDPRWALQNIIFSGLSIYITWLYANRLFTPSISNITDLSRSVMFDNQQLNPSYYGPEVVTGRICFVILILFLLAQNETKALKNPKEWKGWIVSASAILFAFLLPLFVTVITPSVTAGLPLLLLGGPILVGFILSTGDLDSIARGDLSKIIIFRTIIPILLFLYLCFFGISLFPLLSTDLSSTISLMFVILVFSSIYIISTGKSTPSEMERKNSALFFIVFTPLLLYGITRVMFLINNPNDIVARRWNIDWSFMDAPNSFDIEAWPLVPVFGEDSRWSYFLSAAVNSIRVTLVAIILATFLGILIGVLRMSANKLSSGMATVYVELFRNLPLAILLFIIITQIQEWLPLHGSSEAWFLGSNSLENEGLLYFSSQGLWIPLFSSWRIALFGAILFSVWLWMRYSQRNGIDDSDKAVLMRSGIWGTSIILGLAIILIDTSVITLNQPRLDTPAGWLPTTDTSFKVSLSFTAMVLGLTLFTASVISEIVRGSIQALPTGQVEAAISLGLTPYQRLRLVIMPQALRSMIPLLNSQYMNIWKNSSLALVVSYMDIFATIQIMMTNVGQLIPLFILLLVTYQSGSLVISGIMNFFNARVTRVKV
ncbi:MAG: hypothetical protein CMO38_05645 [Verrucomicrobiaceae bacterium]|nr:hypothetical protein [Verrucomicrobiaceae bacterium]